MYNTQRQTQLQSQETNTHKGFYIFTHCACECVWVSVCASSVQGFSMHYDTSETATETEGQRQSETERDSRHVPKWTTGKLQSYVLCTSCHINYAQMLCGCVCVRVCVWATSLAEVRMTTRCTHRNYELHFKCNSVQCLCNCGQLLMPSGCAAAAEWITIPLQLPLPPSLPSSVSLSVYLSWSCRCCCTRCKIRLAACHSCWPTFW